jgi:hypothetical protein
MKIFEFIRKHWLLFIEIIGGAVLAILFFLGLTNNPGKPLLPTIDVKKEKDKIDNEAKDEIKTIDIITEQRINSINAQTDQEVKDNLSVETQLKIQDIKDTAVNNAVDNIIKDLT